MCFHIACMVSCNKIAASVQVLLTQKKGWRNGVALSIVLGFFMAFSLLRIIKASVLMQNKRKANATWAGLVKVKSRKI